MPWSHKRPGPHGDGPAGAGGKLEASVHFQKEVKAAANKRLPEVLEILQAGRFESAFRTAKEVVAYLKISRELGGKAEGGKAEKRKLGRWKP